ncbi:hypothetical protein LCGC14_0826620 [marine sediment metagenome]|uniref:Uncharacterized protein n=1 Tax=marine sediment metagenome TaxID=412755 RepID=A0A0F9SPI7_9ZZZZ
MRRILRENLWMMMVIGAFLVIVAIAKVGWGQEQKPLTPEQKIERLANEKAQAEFNYHNAGIKAVVAENKLRMLQKTYDLLLKQAQKLTAEKVGLMGELKAANEQSSKKVKEYEEKLGQSNDEIVHLASNLEKLNQKYGVLLIQSQELMTEKIELEEKIKQANAKIAQLELKGEEE